MTEPMWAQPVQELEKRTAAFITRMAVLGALNNASAQLLANAALARERGHFWAVYAMTGPDDVVENFVIASINDKPVLLGGWTLHHDGKIVAHDEPVVVNHPDFQALVAHHFSFWKNRISISRIHILRAVTVK